MSLIAVILVLIIVVGVVVARHFWRPLPLAKLNSPASSSPPPASGFEWVPWRPSRRRLIAVPEGAITGDGNSTVIPVVAHDARNGGGWVPGGVSNDSDDNNYGVFVPGNPADAGPVDATYFVARATRADSQFYLPVLSGRRICLSRTGIFMHCYP